MIQCVQNHSVHTMVIDEIGRVAEVRAARTIKERGVRIVASAHGNFRSLLKNPDLNGLLGGVGSGKSNRLRASAELRRRNVRGESRKRQPRTILTQDFSFP